MVVMVIKVMQGVWSIFLLSLCNDNEFCNENLT